VLIVASENYIIQPPLSTLFQIPNPSLNNHNPIVASANKSPIKMSLFTRTNDALNVNPPVGNRHLSVGGSDWLWAVTAVYSFSLIVVVGLAYFAKQGERIFHYLFTISLFVGAISYFTMASDLGSVAIHISDTLSSPGFREIFYVKYINWYVLQP
jgi:bacteriorhodopsin